MTADYWGNPICTTYDGDPNGDYPPGNIVDVGGECLTGPDGVATIENLAPGKYNLYMNAPDGTPWVQTTTYTGGRAIAEAGVTEDDDGTGAIRESLTETVTQPTAYWFGFLRPLNTGTNQIPAAAGITQVNAKRKHVVGCLRDWGWNPPFGAPYIEKREPVREGWIALNNLDIAAEATATYIAPLIDNPGKYPDCGVGKIDIAGVPPGNYQAFLFDEHLNYIFRLYNFTVPNTTAGNQITLEGDDAVDTDGNNVFNCPTQVPNGSLGQIPTAAGTECTGNVGVFRWFGQLSGFVFADTGVADDGTPIPDVPSSADHGTLTLTTVHPFESHAAGPTSGNGVLDCYTDTPSGPAWDPNALDETGFAKDPSKCEVPIPDSPVDIRQRDGTVLLDTSTNLEGYYEFPRALAELNKFQIAEVGFTNFETTGPSLHDEYDWSKVQTLHSEAGGNLLMNQLTAEGKHTFMDWGKRPYQKAPGQIVGITFYDATRNELDARNAAAETYAPGIPDARVNLYKDVNNTPNDTSDDVLVNVYEGTDHWQHPNSPTGGDAADPNGPCDVLNVDGNPPPVAPDFNVPNPDLRQFCGEVPLVGNETKDGAFDGGYAFADYCPNGYDESQIGADEPCNAAGGGHEAPTPLVAGNYVTEAIAPPGYTIEKEEDVNVFHGDVFQPQIPPPPCVGTMHTVDVVDNYAAADYDSSDPANTQGVYNPSLIDVGGSPFQDQQKPLCDKKYIVLKNGANVNSDFFFLPDTEGNGSDSYGVQEPGRWFGWVSDDINVDTDPNSIFYGEPRPVAGVPVTIRDFSYRALTTVYTDEYGFYEALLPTTSSENCPIPQGICPAEFIAVINDPGDPGAPNEGFNPDFLVSPVTFEAWPGTLTLLDTPVDPNSGVACPASSGPDFYSTNTVLLERSSGNWTWSNPGGAGNEVTIRGLNFGANRGAGAEATLGHVLLQNQAGGAPVTVTGAANYPVWNDSTITFKVPGNIAPGPYQLLVQIQIPAPTTDQTIVPDPSNVSATGLTLHLRSAAAVAGGSPYTPSPILYVDQDNPAASDGNAGSETSPFKTIQAAIDAAPVPSAGDSGALVIVKPSTYRENVILDRRLRLQGYGPGGRNGANVQVVQPDELVRHVPGTVIDGRFFSYPTIQADWAARLGMSESAGRVGHPGGDTNVPSGADITVVGNNNQYTPSGSTAQRRVNRALIDGFALQTGVGEGAGGIFANGYARWLKVSNNFIDGNHGHYGGGIQLGMPYRGAGLPGNQRYNASNANTDVTISYNRLVGNGGTQSAGAIGLYNGADNYQVTNNHLCTNFSGEYGAGVSHFGSSDGGLIANNLVMFNDAVDEGGGIFVGGQLSNTNRPGSRPESTGPNNRNANPITIRNNKLTSNMSGDDGGGIRVLNSLLQPIDIVNNFITNNNSAHYGGGIALDDAMNVHIVNDTIARNTTTWSCSYCSDTAELPFVGAGLASEPLGPDAQAMLPNSAPKHSHPYILNTLFYQNEVFQPGLDAAGLPTLDSRGISDLAMVGRGVATEYMHPKHSVVDQATQPTPTIGHGIDLSNRIMPTGGNPFVQDYITSFQFGFSQLGGNIVVNIAGPIVGETLPPGDLGNPGNYHLCAPSPLLLPCTSLLAIDQGRGRDFFNGPENFPGAMAQFVSAPDFAGAPASPWFGDIDGNTRPVDYPGVPAIFPVPAAQRNWDIGADEALFPAPPFEGTLGGLG